MRKRLNNQPFYSMTTHKNLRNLARGAQAIAKAGAKAGAKDGSTTPTDSSECSICLMSIAVCTSFVSQERCRWLSLEALSISIRRPMFARMALQMYKADFERPNMAPVFVPQLSSDIRPRSRSGRTGGSGRLDEVWRNRRSSRKWSA